MLEVLFALLVIGILGASVMRNVIALKTQNYGVQKFLLKNANIFSTQLFINRQFDSIDSKSIIITPTSVAWKQYKNLFVEVPNANYTNFSYMDFSLQTTSAILTLQNNNLYFNNAILLEDVGSMKFWQTNTTEHNILSYEICSSICITDFILLDEIEIQTTTKTKV